eukprot:1161601-Pelagomonas_calceolata.AAC.13
MCPELHVLSTKLWIGVHSRHRFQYGHNSKKEQLQTNENRHEGKQAQRQACKQMKASTKASIQANESRHKGQHSGK